MVTQNQFIVTTATTCWHGWLIIPTASVLGRIDFLSCDGISFFFMLVLNCPNCSLVYE